LIEVVRLSKRYGTTVAVDDLSFTVAPGVVTGFLGPNGAGKSTTMRIILGLDAPSAGAAFVNGWPYATLAEPMREVGALLNPDSAHPSMTARAHLGWLARAAGLPRRRVAEVLDLVGLGSAADRRVGGFSLGMRQRLGIATALLGEPRVLLLDEPVNGLDPQGVIWIRGLLQEQARAGRTVFVSSHLLSETEDLAEHVVVIGKGRLLANMDIEEFIGRGAASRVRVVSPQAGALSVLLAAEGASVAQDSTDGALNVTGIHASRIGDIAAAQGISLHELTPGRRSLEEAFLAATDDVVAYRGELAPAPLQGEHA
jgi:ABC-2 type transport system ATP-binding protein